jgi:hypothetical protein
MLSLVGVSISSLSRCKWAMLRFSAVAAVLTFPAINSALADWWLIRSSDGKCLVVDIEPTEKDNNVTKIGKNVYQSADEAEADAKRLCKEAKKPDQSVPPDQ